VDDHVAVDANGTVIGSASAGGDFDFNLTHCAGKTAGWLWALYSKFAVASSRVALGVSAESLFV
jgi:hypothetical protein